MIIQPLIENLYLPWIKVEKAVNSQYGQIYYLQDDYILIEVIDNGLSMNYEKLTPQLEKNLSPALLNQSIMDCI